MAEYRLSPTAFIRRMSAKMPIIPFINEALQKGAKVLKSLERRPPDVEESAMCDEKLQRYKPPPFVKPNGI
jgi:hypothetical protein